MNKDETALSILHLGTGSFHRAHQAMFLHRVNELKLHDQPRWQLIVGNIRNDMENVMAALSTQEGSYTLETVTPSGERVYERITSISRVLRWTPDLFSVVQTGSSPSCRIISFTVTEGGYYLDEKNNLELSNPDLAADLTGDHRTIYGALALVLSQRRRNDAGAVTFMSCDNLRSNGTRFRAGMRAFLKKRGDEKLLEWFDEFVRCPNSMVDRITPRPTEEVSARVLAATGEKDACPVMAESFVQWVIEDEFAAEKPSWHLVGAEIVSDVLPYEEAKIRILNATHSCIAWAGTLIGLTYIHEGASHPRIRQFAYDYITQDVIPCLEPSPLDLFKYRDVVLERFGNPHIRDTNQRVAADGFSKIKGFITPTLEECLHKDKTPVATAVLPVIFLRFLTMWAKGSLPYKYQDGVMDEKAAASMLASSDPLAALASNGALFGKSLMESGALLNSLREAAVGVDKWLSQPSSH